MGLVPFAFSIHQLVSSVGADVGFAAIIGLAILVLLYFAQARETANLREQALQAAQRVEHLEARIAQVARRQPGSAPAPVGATPAAAVAVSRSVPSAVASRSGAQLAGPPAGVAAPALASATRVMPVPAVSRPAPVVSGADGAGSPAPDGLPVPEPAAVEAPAVASAATGAPAMEPATAGVAAAGPAVSGEEPVVAGVAPLEETSEVTAVAGSGYDEPGGVPPATFAGAGNGAKRDGAYAATVADRGAPQPVAGGGAPPLDRPRARQMAPRRPPREPQAPRRRSRLGLLLALLAGAAAVGVVVWFLLMNNKSSAPTGAASRGSHAAHAGKKAGAFNPSTVTVAVLNGTAVNGLAGRTATRLAALGYKRGTVATASNQTFTSSVVAYMPGRRADALEVARTLRLKPSAVQPIDSSTQAVACPQSPCNAQVVVTAGADITSQ
jgi:LytR cell envelope-related transcriptional attenuator